MKELIASLESLAKQLYLEKRITRSLAHQVARVKKRTLVGYVKQNLLTMTKLYLITVTIPTSSWGGRITNAISIEKRRTIYP